MCNVSEVNHVQDMSLKQLNLVIQWPPLGFRLLYPTNIHPRIILKFWVDITAGASGPRGVRCVRCWTCRVLGSFFESHSRHGSVSAVFCIVLSCVGKGLATGHSPPKMSYKDLKWFTVSEVNSGLNRPQGLITDIRGCIQKFPDWVDNEINKDKHSLRSNTKGYGDKTHRADSQNSDTTASSGRELYYLQFSLQAASPETFGYTLVH